jgi:hypothetical protein
MFSRLLESSSTSGVDSLVCSRALLIGPKDFKKINLLSFEYVAWRVSYYPVCNI